MNVQSLLFSSTVPPNASIFPNIPSCFLFIFFTSHLRQSSKISCIKFWNSIAPAPGYLLLNLLLNAQSTRHSSSCQSSYGNLWLSTVTYYFILKLTSSETGTYCEKKRRGTKIVPYCHVRFPSMICCSIGMSNRPAWYSYCFYEVLTTIFIITFSPSLCAFTTFIISCALSFDTF